MDLMGIIMADNLRQLKTTVLFRKEGVWHREEVGRLVNGLMTEVSQHPENPEYLVLRGHYTKEETLRALIGGVAYTATQVTGADAPELPFKRPFF